MANNTFIKLFQADENQQKQIDSVQLVDHNLDDSSLNENGE
jgi:hypothetical protein